MSLEYDSGLFLRAQQEKNKNFQNRLASIQGMGEGLGKGVGALGEYALQKKQKAQWQQTINQMLNDPNTPPAVRQVLPMIAQKPEFLGQVLPSALKQATQRNNFRPVSGMFSKANHPLVIDESTGTMKEVPEIDVQSSSRPAASDLGQVTWENASQDERDLATALYNGDIRPYDLGYRERSKAVVLANEYANRNKLPPYRSFGGDVKSGTAKAFAFGKPAMNVLSLNTALGHAKSALLAYNAVQNLDQRFLNIPLNKVRAMTNNPNIVKLQTALNALAGELATVFKGTGGTDQEIAKWYNVLSSDLTPAQAPAVIKQVNELLNSRLNALNQMRSQGTSNRPATGSLLSPHAAELNKQFDSMGKGASDGWSYVGPAQ